LKSVTTVIHPVVLLARPIHSTIATRTTATATRQPQTRLRCCVTEALQLPLLVIRGGMPVAGVRELEGGGADD
jgi:hypothetical protein